MGLAGNRNKIKCPACGAKGIKVIYAAIPAKFCTNMECNTLWGRFSFLITLLPFNGWFFVYEGNYFRALFSWLFGKNKETG